jgi:D-serine deaminase-like pyridoxal phosphate-dependent protein
LKLIDLETPALLINKTQLELNAERMFTRARELGVQLRPHVKTLKSIEAAEIYAPQPMPVTVSTLREAEAFAAAGYQDILYGVGIAANKLSRAASLIRNGVTLRLFVDSLSAADAVCEAAQSLQLPFHVFIELDVDGHRAGVPPKSNELLTIAAALARCEHVTLCGVASHAGESYNCRSLEEIAAMAEQERALTVEAAEFLAENGHSISHVSVGSTPTALAAQSLEGVTELRAGVYASFDLVMAGLNVCSIDDIALSVLTTVIGHQPARGWIIVDAGWMATSSDRGTASQMVDQGFGLVCDENGILLDDLVLSAANQEQGIITHRQGKALEPVDFPYGTRLRILPVHACATASQHSDYFVVDADAPTQVQAIWKRVNNW